MNIIPPHCVTSPDILEKYSRDAVLQGSPEALHLARDFQDVAEILSWAHFQKVPVTFCGSRTSMTGSSSAPSGIVIALENKNKILNIDKCSDGGMIDVEPGVILGDLKNIALKENLFYPPDPTSYREAQIGGTIATNATGEDTLRYGPTRLYVEELEILTANGKSQKLVRKNKLHLDHFKNTAGYFLHGDPIDEIIGSEGTLALITRAKLKLLSKNFTDICLFILPFSNFEKCISAVPYLVQLNPRALELIGPGAVKYFTECADCPPELYEQNCFLIFKIEYSDSQLDKITETLSFKFEEIYSHLGERPQLENIFLASSDAQLESIRRCRHYIPSKVNEKYFSYQKSGGGKIGTDWWVPLHHLEEVMIQTYRESLESKLDFIVFAHIGNGHPHWNYLCKNDDEKKRALSLVENQCRRAALLYGGVAGEHGIGKTKKNLLPIQHSAKTIQLMKKIKQKWDPHEILGVGNIF